MTDLHAQSLAELSAGLEKGEFSSVELTQALLERIAAHGDVLNAFITVTGEQALATAGRADKARADFCGVKARYVAISLSSSLIRCP